MVYGERLLQLGLDNIQATAQVPFEISFTTVFDTTTYRHTMALIGSRVDKNAGKCDKMFNRRLASIVVYLLRKSWDEPTNYWIFELLKVIIVSY